MANRAGGFIEYEANGFRSRETVTVDATGGALVAGSVLGKITATGAYVMHETSAADGSETAVAVLFDGVDAVSGDAVVIARDAEVAGVDLTYESAATPTEIAAVNVELAAAGIIVR
jgi:hypothetical protein